MKKVKTKRPRPDMTSFDAVVAKIQRLFDTNPERTRFEARCELLGATTPGAQLSVAADFQATHGRVVLRSGSFMVALPDTRLHALLKALGRFRAARAAIALPKTPKQEMDVGTAYTQKQFPLYKPGMSVREYVMLCSGVPIRPPKDPDSGYEAVIKEFDAQWGHLNRLPAAQYTPTCPEVYEEPL